jgi:molybdate transport system substrate-binding protein
MSATLRAIAALIALLCLAACSSGAAPATPVAASSAPTQASAQATAQSAAQTAGQTFAGSPPPGAAPTAPASAAPVAGEIVVFAASSLTDAFQELAVAFQQANPNARVTFNFGASSQLATQLGQGARGDVFASADQTQMDNARKADAIVGQDRVFARNRLVLITPRDNPRQIVALRDLARDGVKFVTAQPSVPIGQYTAQILDKATADPAYGPDFKTRVDGNTVSREDNVRQVVSKVQLGEADAAIVYSTDATPQVRDNLQVIQIPDALQTLAAYPIAVARGSNAAGGEAFVTYVLAVEGQAILARWGFLPMSSGQPDSAAPPTPPVPSAPAASAPGALAPGAASVPAAAAPAAATMRTTGAEGAGVAVPLPVVASATFSPTVAIAGLVNLPRSLSRDDLLNLPAETAQVSYLAGQSSESGTFTGTRLLNVFDAAGGPHLPTDVNNAKLRLTVMLTGADGYQVALDWGELDPEYGAAPILLAYARDGQPMGDRQGMARLVVPGDKRGGRYVSMVKRIEVRDPGPAQP